MTEETRSRRVKIPKIVIIVDDDDVHRSMHALYAESTFSGVRQFVFMDGEEAWNFFQRKEIEIGEDDILITDCSMPKMNGIDLVKKVQEAGIGLRIHMFSGGSLTSADDAKEAGIRIYGQKPYLKEFWDKIFLSI